MGLVETTGSKDLRLDSSGKPWPLVHLTFAPWDASPSWGGWLRGCGERLAARTDGALACFALDQRLAAHHQWLENAGIAAGAGCTVYGLALPGWVDRTEVVHLATSEI